MQATATAQHVQQGEKLFTASTMAALEAGLGDVTTLLNASGSIKHCDWNVPNHGLH